MSERTVAAAALVGMVLAGGWWAHAQSGGTAAAHERHPKQRSHRDHLFPHDASSDIRVFERDYITLDLVSLPVVRAEETYAT